MVQIMEMVENLRVIVDLAVLSMSYCPCRLEPLAEKGSVGRMKNYNLQTVRFANLGDALAGSSNVVNLGISSVTAHAEQLKMRKNNPLYFCIMTAFLVNF